jgi:SAM-dependent methyltransferase
MSSGNPRNPWLDIPASDYEGHMGPGGAGQLSALSTIFGDVYGGLRPLSVAVLGCATGNGFERINLDWTRRLVAVDINPEYLEILRRRHEALEPILEVVCAQVENCSLRRASFDLISSALIFEYLDPAVLLGRISSWLAPEGVLSVVLQLPSPKHGVVTDTRYASLRVLEGMMRLIPPAEFKNLASDAGLRNIEAREHVLRNGKRFYVGLFANE